MNDTHPTMAAQTINRFGEANVFATEAIPRPEVEPGHVLVRVEATSVNLMDYMV